MSNFNKVILVGNLVRDPKLTYTQDGLPVARLRIAVNKKTTVKGTRGKTTTVNESVTLNVVAEGGNAELVSKYLHKGNPILVDGYLASAVYVDAQGNEHDTIEVKMSSFQFLPRTGRVDGPEGDCDERD